MTPIVVLVGPPGAGKTTVAFALGDRLGVDVRDTDADIEHSTGKSVSDIFVADGEAAFRAHERDAVAAALSGHEGVLALGGGAVEEPRNRRLLEGHRVVFLDVSLSEAATRVGLNAARPLLMGNVRSQLKALLDQRRPAYVEVASLVVSSDRRGPDDVVEEIIEFLTTEGVA